MPGKRAPTNPSLRFMPTGGTAETTQAHVRSDVDFGPGAIHHTLGDGRTQAAPGDHNHDSRYALAGMTNMAVSRRRDADQTILRNTSTRVFFNVAEVTNANIPWDGTNEEWTIKYDGLYLICAQLLWELLAGGENIRLQIAVNGAIVVSYRGGTSGVQSVSQATAKIFNLKANDKIAISCWTSANPSMKLLGGLDSLWASISYIGGAPGPKGDPGLPGPPGSGGSGGLRTYEQTFVSAATDWTITHNFNSLYVEVNCYEPGGAKQYDPDIEVLSPNTVIVHWYYPTVGVARVIG